MAIGGLENVLGVKKWNTTYRTEIDLRDAPSKLTFGRLLEEASKNAVDFLPRKR